MERMTHQIRLEDLPDDFGERFKINWHDKGVQKVDPLDFTTLLKKILPEEFVHDSL
jgi:hypothetical protein